MVYQMSTFFVNPLGRRSLSLYLQLPAMGNFFRRIGLTIFCILLISELTHAQSYGEDFWSNPNVIWKTYTGTIITAAFAKKMHTQGNYAIMQRDLRGGRKEVKMVPPKKQVKKTPGSFNWNDPALVIKDDAGQILPNNMHRLLLRLNSIKWSVDTLSSGAIEVVFNLGSSKPWKSAWTESNIQYVREWTDRWRGKQLPNFSFIDLDGKVVNNNAVKDQFLVLNFWNSKCDVCVKEIKQLNRTREAFYDEKVTFLAPTFEQSGTVSMFLETYNFNYKILADAQSLIDDLGLEYYPTYMIVDKDGTILDINVGGAYNIGEEIGKRLSWLLTENSSR